MNWDDIKEAIRAQVAKLTGIQTVIREGARPQVDMSGPNGGNICIVSFPTVVGLGWDEFREDPSDDGETIEVKQNGIRNASCTVLVESYQENPSNSALHYIELVREGMERPQVCDALDAAAGVYVYSVTGSRDHTHVEDDHDVPSASLDLLFTVMINVRQEDVGLGQGLDNVDYINEVSGTGVVFQPGTTGTTAASIPFDFKGPGQP